MRPRPSFVLTALVGVALTVGVAPATARPLAGDGATHDPRTTADTSPVTAVAAAAVGQPAIHVEELTRTGDASVRGTFTDDVEVQVRLRLDGAPGTDVMNLGNPSSIAVARLVVEPGARFPWHTHPGPVLISVVQGDLVYVNATDCIERPYTAGTAFVDPGRGNVHTAFNDGDEDAVLVATFLDADATGPLTITDVITAPEDCDTGPTG